MEQRFMVINSLLLCLVATTAIIALNLSDLMLLQQHELTVLGISLGLLVVLTIIPKERFKNKYNVVFFYGFIAVSIAILEFLSFENYAIHIYHLGMIILAMVYLGPKKGRIIAAMAFAMGIIYGFTTGVHMEPFIMYLFIAFSSLFTGNMIVFLGENNSSLSQSYNEVKTLYKISNLIDYYSDTEEILYNIAKIITDAIHLDSCYILKFNDVNEILEVETAYGSNLKENMVFNTSDSIAGRVYESGRKIICNSLTKDEYFGGMIKYGGVMETIGVFPLNHNQGNVGVLIVGSEEEKPLTKKDIRFLETIAGNVAKVIDNDKKYKEVEYSLKLDQLSGLFNQKTFYETLDQELLYAADKKKGLYVMMMDVDEFKKINDVHGHIVGDKVIRAISRVIQNSVRGSDYACRYGGEEFAVIFTDASVDVVKKVANRIQEQLKLLHLEIQELDHPITMSIGISSCEDCDEDPKKLLEIADQRMYTVKNLGGDDYKIS